MKGLDKLAACVLLSASAAACSANGPAIASLARSEVPVTDDEVPGLSIDFVDSEQYRFSQSDRTAIQAIAASAVREVRTLVSGVPPQIVLTVRAGTAVILETGEAGVALAPGKIGWTVDPARTGGPEAVARARLRSTLFHEVHHLARGWTIEGGTAGRRLIDAAIAEGLATAFERDATGSNPPWGDYPQDVRVSSEQLIALPDTAAYWQWMFQHSDGRRWIGYRAGTYLADRAAAASGRSSADLASMPTDELLALSGCMLVPPACRPSFPALNGQ